MKKLILLLIVISALSACNSRSGQRKAVAIDHNTLTVTPESVNDKIMLKYSYEEMKAFAIAGRGRIEYSTPMVAVIKTSKCKDSLIYVLGTGDIDFKYLDRK